MALKSVEFVITGTAPMLMHNVRLADPLDPFAKEVKRLAGKRAKTDADHLEISNVEWEGSLYWSDELGLHIPGVNMETALKMGGAARKLKKKFEAGVVVDDTAIIHSGPKTMEALRDDKRFRDRRACTVNKSKIMRTRPKIPVGWKAEVVVKYDDSRLNKSDIEQAMRTVGEEIGIGAYRPRFGRFTVETVK